MDEEVLIIINFNPMIVLNLFVMNYYNLVYFIDYYHYSLCSKMKMIVINFHILIFLKLFVLSYKKLINLIYHQLQLKFEDKLDND